MANENWFVVFDKRKDKFRVSLYFFLASIPMIALLSFIHETGHCIIALIFGWKIYEMNISFFPFVYEMEYSWVSIGVPFSSIEEWQLILFLCGGSLHTLFWGYIFFLIYYKIDLPLFLEICLFMFSFFAVTEMLFYIIIDIFYAQFGDWYLLYQINPAIVGIFLSISMLNLGLFLKNYRVIKERVDD